MAAQLPKTLTAVDLMTPNPRTCSTFSSVIEAVMIFRDADCGAVPVVDDGKPVGVLTDRDVALALAEHGADLPQLTVSALMSRDPVTVAPDDPLEVVIEKIGTERVRRLLVLDKGGLLVGIISWADIAPHVPERTIGRAVSEVVEQP
jgi:CBS domain-containing protein